MGRCRGSRNLGRSPNKSNPYLALAGIAPLDGSQLPQIDADPDGRHANKAELEMVAIWITNNAPA
jgi:hypothetical protein